MWWKILKNKYLKTKTLAEIEANPTNSPLWKGILHGKDEFLREDLL
jgi:hypothetical protein